MFVMSMFEIKHLYTRFLFLIFIIFMSCTVPVQVYQSPIIRVGRHQ